MTSKIQKKTSHHLTSLVVCVLAIYFIFIILTCVFFLQKLQFRLKAIDAIFHKFKFKFFDLHYTMFSNSDAIILFLVLNNLTFVSRHLFILLYTLLYKLFLTNSLSDLNVFQNKKYSSKISSFLVNTINAV